MIRNTFENHESRTILDCFTLVGVLVASLTADECGVLSTWELNATESVGPRICPYKVATIILLRRNLPT